jgi:hypothetical protein
MGAELCVKSTDPGTPTKTATERNGDLELQARADGFKPLDAKRLAALAVGTEAEAEDLLSISAELRDQGRRRRRSSSS